MTEAGYPNGFETELWSAYNHTTAQKVTQFLQQQLGQIGIKAKITLLEAGQRVEKVESWQDPANAPVRLYYVGWSTSTGEADWALRPLLYGGSWPPSTFQYGVLQESESSTPTSRTRSSRPTRRRRPRFTRMRSRQRGTMRRGRRWSRRSCSRHTTRSCPAFTSFPTRRSISTKSTSSDASVQSRHERAAIGKCVIRARGVRPGSSSQ